MTFAKKSNVALMSEKRKRKMTPILDKILFWIYATLMWAVLLFTFAMVWASCDVNPVYEDGVPDEPALTYKTNWEPKPSGVVVIEYLTAGGLTVYFVHSIQQEKPTDHWRPARREDGRLYLTTIEAAPTQYAVSSGTIAFRYAWNPVWTPVIDKSWCRSCGQ